MKLRAKTETLFQKGRQPVIMWRAALAANFILVVWIWSVMAIARNVAAIWKLRTANIGAQAGTAILRLRNIAQFGRKKRAAIADIKRATN